MSCKNHALPPAYGLEVRVGEGLLMDEGRAGVRIDCRDFDPGASRAHSRDLTVLPVLRLS